MPNQLQKLLIALLMLILLFYQPVALILAMIIIVIFIKKEKEYKSTTYYQITQIPYLSLRRDTGRYGEYLTYQQLKHNEETGARFLFNLYIPKSNGETTEIDVLMICNKGIFVFESKNYSGWIFGSEQQKNWYQTLPAGRRRSHKEPFYNPVMQNRSHIKHLKSLLGNQLPMKSIIVFSDRCTLKSVQINSTDISVINRYDVASVVSTICHTVQTNILSEKAIDDIYNKLFPFSQVDGQAKAQHVANIQNTLSGQSLRHSSSGNASSAIPTSQTTVNCINRTTATKNEQVPKCPRCNSTLVLRTAHRGANAGKQFYGCSNYPKCKYIQNIATKTV